MSSSLLEQAIIDADELKEAALKNAESSILEKYSTEVKEAVDSLLEQEDDEEEDSSDLDIIDAIPLAATEGEDLCPCPDDEEEVELDLDQIAAIASLEAGEAEESEEVEDMMSMSLSEEQDTEGAEEELSEEEEHDLKNPEKADLNKDGELSSYEKKRGKAIEKAMEKKNEEAIKMPDIEEGEIEGMEGPFQFRSGAVLYWDPKEGEYYDRGEDRYITDEEAEVLIMEDDELDITEEELYKIVEELVVDMKPVPHGKNFHAHQTEAEAEYDLDISLAREQDTDVAEELEELRKAVKKLEEQNETLKLQKNKLAEDYKSLKGVAREAVTKLDEVNFTNAKLIYTNRTLKSDSLNERQKAKLVEAISKVDSVEEAKIVFETLSSNISARKETGPKNLSEAVSKNNGLILKSNNENKPANANQVDRLKRLAGII